ncbi:MAG: hypothetical protein IT186_02045 [Acidobacteria bacterium]|nr:hypothetical protein [Acidobacteriota bacterium]
MEGQPIPHYFEGTIDDVAMTFRLQRFIAYNNSFLPVLIGRIDPSTEGSSLTVFARPPVFASVFTLAWFALTSFDLFDAASGALPLALRVAMPLFALLLYFGAFIPELLRSRKALEALLSSSFKPTSGY